MERILLIQYLYWHFFDTSKEILLAWKNFLWFNLNYFSVSVLLKTFFSHWHGYRLSFGKRFDPWRYFEAFVFNSFSRVIGVILRTLFILLGILLEIPIIIGGLIIFLGWLILPLLLIMGLMLGIGLIS